MFTNIRQLVEIIELHENSRVIISTNKFYILGFREVYFNFKAENNILLYIKI